MLPVSNLYELDKFTGKPKIFSDPTSSQKSLKQQINVYITLRTVYKVNGTAQYIPRHGKTPFLESYYFHVKCPTNIRPYSLKTTHPPNTFQQHLSTVLLQDVAQLINIFLTRILFDHAVFKTDLFLKDKETIGTLFSTSVNQLFQSLKAVMSELSSQVTNLQYGVNGSQGTSLDFLRSNFRQINDNVTTIIRINK